MMRLLEIHIYVSLVLLSTSVIGTRLTYSKIKKGGWKPFSVLSLLTACWMWFIPVFNIACTYIVILNTFVDTDIVINKYKNKLKQKH